MCQFVYKRERMHLSAVPCAALDVSIAPLDAVFTPVHLRNVVRVLHRGLTPIPVPSSCKACHG
jgi:hypothetical protein